MAPQSKQILHRGALNSNLDFFILIQEKQKLVQQKSMQIQNLVKQMKRMSKGERTKALKPSSRGSRVNAGIPVFPKCGMNKAREKSWN